MKDSRTHVERVRDLELLNEECHRLGEWNLADETNGVYDHPTLGRTWRLRFATDRNDARLLLKIIAEYGLHLVFGRLLLSIISDDIDAIGIDGPGGDGFATPCQIKDRGTAFAAANASAEQIAQAFVATIKVIG